MESAPSRWLAVAQLKCPRCRRGDLFTSAQPYDLKNLGKMPDNCTYCGQDFDPEPGFYFGATYVSYAFMVAFFVTGFIANWLTFGFDIFWTGVVLIGLYVLLSPMIFRMSRSIWLAFFVSFDPGAGPDNPVEASSRAMGKQRRG